MQKSTSKCSEKTLPRSENLLSAGSSPCRPLPACSHAAHDPFEENYLRAAPPQPRGPDTSAQHLRHTVHCGVLPHRCGLQAVLKAAFSGPPLTSAVDAGREATFSFHWRHTSHNRPTLNQFHRPSRAPTLVYATQRPECELHANPPAVPPLSFFAGQRITFCVYSSSLLNLLETSRATSPKRAPQTQCSQLSSWLRA